MFPDRGKVYRFTNYMNDQDNQSGRFPDASVVGYVCNDEGLRIMVVLETNHPEWEVGEKYTFSYWRECVELDIDDYKDVITLLEV